MYDFVCHVHVCHVHVCHVHVCHVHVCHVHVCHVHVCHVHVCHVHVCHIHVCLNVCAVLKLNRYVYLILKAYYSDFKNKNIIDENDPFSE